MKEPKQPEIETTFDFMPKFDAAGLIPVIAQDWQTRQVLMLAYMNQETLTESINSGEAVYWSRSRQARWKKGETSGHSQKIREILVDCDQDALVILIDQVGGAACHTGATSCFYRVISGGESGPRLRSLHKE